MALTRAAMRASIMARRRAGPPVRYATNASSSSSSSSFSATRILGIGVFGGLVGTTGMLGAWQTERYSWKKMMIEKRKAKLAAAPLAVDVSNPSAGLLASTVGSANGSRTAATAKGTEDDDKPGTYQVVTLSGQFEDAQTVFVGPRAPPKHSAPFDNPTGEKSGYFVMTPFRLADSNGGRVLVSRGWVPRSAMKDGRQDQIPGRLAAAAASSAGGATATRIVGVTREGESKSTYAMDPDLAQRRFFWLDLPTIAQFTDGRGADCTDAFVEVLPGAPADTAGVVVPKPMEAHMDFYVTPTTHAGYAATWFSLTAAGAVLTFMRFFRRVR